MRKPAVGGYGRRMVAGSLTLRRFIGEEEFELATTQMRVHDEHGQLGIVLEFTCGEAASTLTDTEDLHARPAGDVVFFVDSIDALIGATVEVPTTFDESRNRHVSRLYYVEHQGLENNRITFVERRGHAFLIRWVGLTTDVNHYDGSKPDTELVIEGWFAWDSQLTPGRAESG